jgi:MFS family permease
VSSASDATAFQPGSAGLGWRPAGDPRGIARGAWLVFAILFLGHLLDSFDRWLVPAVLGPLSEDLSLNDTQAGGLATDLLIGYAVWCPVIGYLADRFGRPRLLAVGLALWSLATVGTGLAETAGAIRLARALVGIGGASFGVVGLTMLMDLFPRGARSRVAAAFYAAFPLGAAAAWNLGPFIAREANWQSAFLLAGAPGFLLALVALLVPEKVRGASEGIEEARLRLHEQIGPSREDYLDLMVNSSYTYSVFGLAFTMFAIAGLVSWLPTYFIVERQLSYEQVGRWLGVTLPAAMLLGIVGGGWCADQLARVHPRAWFLVPAAALLGAIPVLLGGLFTSDDRLSKLGLSLAIALMFSIVGPCLAVVANVVMPNMRGVAYAGVLAASHLLGDLWSPTLMGWVAHNFGQPDMMATPLGQALAAIGAVPQAQPGYDPQNLAAALLTAVPALLIAGIVLLAGTRHLPRELALMLAKLRAQPTRLLAARATSAPRRPAPPTPPPTTASADAAATSPPTPTHHQTARPPLPSGDQNPDPIPTPNQLEEPRP